MRGYGPDQVQVDYGQRASFKRAVEQGLVPLDLDDCLGRGDTAVQELKHARQV